MKRYFKLVKDTFNQWMNNEPFQESAIISYYMLFSLPSLLVIVITVAGYFLGQQAVQNDITEQIGGIVGEDAASSIETMISNAFIEGGSVWAIIISLGILIFGSTTAFFQLKRVMNKIWSVRVKKQNFGRMLLDRAISLGMILVIGLLLLVSLVLSSVITGLSEYIADYAPNITALAVRAMNFLISYIFIGALFAAVFKLLPDIHIRWKVTFIGASVTTVLFLIGEYVLTFYFGQSDPGSVYGGASSVVIILLWIYYSCMILFLGAEFTVQYALFKGEKVTCTSVSEPAIYQEMEEMRERKLFMEEKKNFLGGFPSQEEEREEKSSNSN